MFTIFAASLLILAGCSGGDDDAKGKESTSKTKEPADERTLTIAITTDVVTFDIHDHNNTSTEAVHINMFNYLVRKDADGEFQSDLAESYENIDDHTWEFTLHEGVTFHNGDELTAKDVKYTLERVANDEGLREYSQYRQIKEVEVIDDYNFRIITHEPEPVLLNRLSRLGSGILPSDYIEENGWDHFLTNPVGTGPFKFTEWKRDSELVFDVYEDYFQGQVEQWDKLIFRIIPEDSTRVAEVLTGGVDIAVNMPDHEWGRVDDNDGTSIQSVDSQRVAGMLIRHDDEYPTSDPRVREAIDLAIDNSVLTESVLGGSGVPVRSRVTPGNTGANEDLYDTYVYDPEKAKELLAEAGYADGLEITIHGPNGRYTKDKDIQEMIAGMLEQVGITVKTDLMEWSNFVDLRASYKYDDAYFIALGNSMFDASIAVDTFRSERAMESQGYSNPELDKLIDAAESNMHLDERNQQYYEIQEIIAEDRPYIYLYAERSNYAVNDRLSFEPRKDEMIIAEDITAQ